MDQDTTARCWITSGTGAEYIEDLALYAARGTRSKWTLHPDARAGDEVLFYWAGPVKAFIAVGRVAGWSRKQRLRKPLAWISGIQLLPTPVHLLQARRELPAARWLKAPAGFGRDSCSKEDYNHLVALGRAGLLVFAVQADSLPQEVQDALLSMERERPDVAR